MSDEVKPDLRALFEFIDKPLPFKHEEGDYCEEDENGVVFFRRKNGAMVLMMPRSVYDELVKWEAQNMFRALQSAVSGKETVMKGQIQSWNSKRQRK